MKKSCLFKLPCVLALLFFGPDVFAQNARLYMNKQEIAPQSVHFLEAATIDSINFYSGAEAHEKLNLQTQGVDSVFVIFKKDMSDVVSYSKLFSLYHFDDRAQLLPLTIGMSHNNNYIDKARSMIFNINHVTSVSVNIMYNTNTDYVSIWHTYDRPYNSLAGKMLTWLQGYIEGYGDNSYYRNFKTK